MIFTPEDGDIQRLAAIFDRQGLHFAVNMRDAVESRQSPQKITLFVEGYTPGVPAEERTVQHLLKQLTGTEWKYEQTETLTGPTRGPVFQSVVSRDTAYQMWEQLGEGTAPMLKFDKEFVDTLNKPVLPISPTALCMHDEVTQRMQADANAATPNVKVNPIVVVDDGSQQKTFDLRPRHP